MLSDYGLRFGQLITPAAAGLLGVLAGRWMTARNQKRELYHNRIREQLELFFSPLVGLRLQIRSKSELRARLNQIADAAWQKRLESVRHDPESE